MPQPTISVIIINYKTPELTINCVNSLLSLSASPNKEIIVVDNAPGDGGAEKIEQEVGDKIKLIKSETNLGFAGGNNKGTASARGDILFFLNSDTIVGEDIFTECLQTFQKQERVGVVSPRLKMEDGDYQPFAFGLFPTFGRLVTGATKKELTIPEGKDILEVDWVSGCALMIKKDLFQKIKGWDEQYFLYYEDIDLCKKAKEQGYKVVVNLNTELLHLGGKSLDKSRERKKYYYRSQDHYFQKHHIFLTYLAVKAARSILVLAVKPWKRQ